MAVAAGSSNRKKYAFDRETEAAIAFVACSLPQFFKTIGHAIDPERMPSADAALVMRAVHSVAKTLGSGCPSKVVAMQAVRTEVDNGRVSHAQANAATAIVNLGECLFSLDDVDALLAVIIPVIQRVAQY